MKIYKKGKALLTKKHPILIASKMLLWFSLGAFLGLFFLISFMFIFYQKSYKDAVYPGVFVNGVDMGGKTQEEVKEIFTDKNEKVAQAVITFTSEDIQASSSAKHLKLGFDADLISNQAYSIGRTGNLFSDINLLFDAYLHGITLNAAYSLDDEQLMIALSPITKAVTREPQNALFSFENGKVSAFKTALNGQTVDIAAVKKIVLAKASAMEVAQAKTVVISVPLTITEPDITNEEANDLGIEELVATGTSLYTGSIENRIYNLTLASSRLNGILIKPGEVFSFNKTVGDISTLTGYKQAYVISGGKTILGDGGGVCQVSTTLFRAIINAGLPIMERNPHAYRVSYYEKDMGPGVDAAIYTPNVDLKFKNDTGNYLLIQSYVDPAESRLTFELYGTRDGREVLVEKPVITSQSPAPEPVYQDDPELPKGQTKQIDWAAPGAKVYFKRTVTKNGQVLSEDTFYSNYRPWQAVYLRGTKEG